MKWYSTPSFSPGRGARVVCETENRRPSSSFRTRVTTVVLPAPEGAETTITLPRAPSSLNVLHLFPDLLDLRLQVHDLAHDRRVRRLAPQRVRLPGQLLGQEVEALARRLLAPQELPGHGHVAAQTLQFLAHIVPLDRPHDLLAEARLIQPEPTAELAQPLGPDAAPRLPPSRRERLHAPGAL